MVLKSSLGEVCENITGRNPWEIGRNARPSRSSTTRNPIPISQRGQVKFQTVPNPVGRRWGRDPASHLRLCKTRDRSGRPRSYPDRISRRGWATRIRKYRAFYDRCGKVRTQRKRPDGPSVVETSPHFRGTVDIPNLEKFAPLITSRLDPNAQCTVVQFFSELR